LSVLASHKTLNGIFRLWRIWHLWKDVAFFCFNDFPTTLKQQKTINQKVQITHTIKKLVAQVFVRLLD